jgi:hypothetical protein
MTARRTLTFLVLALALLAPAAAYADKKPVRTTPKIYILLTDGATNKTVSPSIQTSFSPPKGATTAKACKGNVTVSAPIGKKTVKKKKKTIYATKKSALKTRLGVCTATSFLPLPASFYGKTVKFTASFPGNDVVKKFKKSSTFKVVTPPLPQPAPTPPVLPNALTFTLAAGGWQFTSVATPTLYWTTTMNAFGEFSYLQRKRYIAVSCPGHTARILSSDPTEEAPFNVPFTPTTIDTTVTANWGVSYSEHVVSTFKLHFESPTKATGSFKIEGRLFSDGDFREDCTTGEIPIVATAN